MGMSKRTGSSRRHLEQEGSIKSQSSRAAGVRSQLDKESIPMVIGSRDKNNDLLNKLITYQTI